LYKNAFLTNRVLAFVAGALVIASLFANLGRLPLLQPDEGRNAEVAREMKVSGAWLVPTYNGVVYLDKPAFYFKAVALSLAAFGDNETAARIPSAVFGGALVLLVFAFARKVHGLRTGLIAAIIVSTTPLFLIYSRTVIFDIALTFFVCAAIFAGYLAEESEGAARRRWYLLGAAAAGLGTLVKGPVGFLVPSLVLLVYHRLEGRRGVWKRMLAPINLAVFFALTLPWFIGLCLARPDFFHYGLVEESFNRFTQAKKFHRSEPFYFYALIIAGTFFPWSLTLVEGAAATWRNRQACTRPDRFYMVWAVLVVVFFSISQSKLAGYILSVTVASGLLVARLVVAAIAAPDGPAARVLKRAMLVFGIFCLVAAGAWVAGSSHAGALAKPLRIPTGEAVRFYHGLLPAVVLLGVFGVLALLAWLRRSAGMALLCLAAFTPLLINLDVGAFEVIFGSKSIRSMARQMPTLPADTEVASLAYFPNGLPFYLGHTLTLITEDGGELTSNYILFCLKDRTQWPKNLVPLDQFDQWLAGRKTPVYLIVRKEDEGKLVTLAAERGAKIQKYPPKYLGALLMPKGS
jgi:4-amino-4-deoxy-L-arabinose transferase-like glycosyltransferase